MVFVIFDKFITVVITSFFGPSLNTLVENGTYAINIQGGGGGSHRLTLCQGPRSCRARIRKTQSKLRPLVKISPNYTIPNPTCSFCANVHLRQGFWKTVKVTKRSCDVTPRSKYQKSKGHPWPPCAPNIVQFRPLFPELRHFEKRHTPFFYRSAAILKVLVRPNWFSNLSEPWVKESRLRILEQFRLFYRGHSTSWHICAREAVKGQMEL